MFYFRKEVEVSSSKFKRAWNRYLYYQPLFRFVATLLVPIVLSPIIIFSQSQVWHHSYLYFEVFFLCLFFQEYSICCGNFFLCLCMSLFSGIFYLLWSHTPCVSCELCFITQQVRFVSHTQVRCVAHTSVGGLYYTYTSVLHINRPNISHLASACAHLVMMTHPHLVAIACPQPNVWAITHPRLCIW